MTANLPPNELPDLIMGRGGRNRRLSLVFHILGPRHGESLRGYWSYRIYETDFLHYLVYIHKSSHFSCFPFFFKSVTIVHSLVPPATIYDYNCPRSLLTLVQTFLLNVTTHATKHHRTLLHRRLSNHNGRSATVFIKVHSPVREVSGRSSDVTGSPLEGGRAWRAHKRGGKCRGAIHHNYSLRSPETNSVKRLPPAMDACWAFSGNRFIITVRFVSKQTRKKKGSEYNLQGLS